MTIEHIGSMRPLRPARGARDGVERLTHWTLACATLTLIGSGWEIYNAAPFYPVAFPGWATLGDGLTEALLWHFAAMWLLGAAILVILVRRLIFRRGVPLLPLSPRGALQDAAAAARGRLGHDLARYNHVQRVLYLGVLLGLAAAAATGLALWKPVQLAWIADALGGYEAVRRVHFWLMAAIVAFLCLHLAMAMLVPRTIAAMVLGLREGRGR